MSVPNRQEVCRFAPHWALLRLKLLAGRTNFLITRHLTYPSPLYYVTSSSGHDRVDARGPKLHIDPQPHIEGERGSVL